MLGREISTYMRLLTKPTQPENEGDWSAGKQRCCFKAPFKIKHQLDFVFDKEGFLQQQKKETPRKDEG